MATKRNTCTATATASCLQPIKTTVLISYNSVEGFNNGWHQGKRLFVHANGDGQWGSDTGNGNNDRKRATSVMASLSHNFYGKLEVPVKDVDDFFIYAGLNAMKSALELALHLKQLSNGSNVTVVACTCNWKQKESILEGSGINLLQCGCGGRTKLGEIANAVLS